MSEHGTVKRLLAVLVRLQKLRRVLLSSMLCYTLVSVLLLGIGIGCGQYYWILGCFLGIVLTLFTTCAYWQTLRLQVEKSFLSVISLIFKQWNVILQIFYVIILVSGEFINTSILR